MTPTAPPRHTEYLAKQLEIWHDHLRAPDLTRRLEGLRAIHAYVEALITQEYTTARPQVTAPPLSPIKRFMAHIRRVR